MLSKVEAACAFLDDYVVFTVPVVNIGIYGLTKPLSGEAELILADLLNPL